MAEIAGLNHALLSGQVCGALVRAEIEAQPEVNESGDYTGRVFIDRPSGRWILTLQPCDGTEP